MSDTYKKVSEEELVLLSHKDMVRFALFCAEQVKEGWKGIPEYVAAVETAERWLKEKATEEECRVATRAAYYANAATRAANAATRAAYAAYYAANAAYAASHGAYANATSSAAYAAYYAAYANGKPHLIEAQWEYYLELLHFDDIAEKLLLGESV